MTFRSIAVLFLLISTSALHAMVADTVFIKTYGGVNSEEFRDIIQTPDSGFLMTGFTNGFGQGSNAVYVVKTKKDGTPMWSRALGGNAADVSYSMCTDGAGNYYIAGTSNSPGTAGGYDGYLICLDINGNTLWEKFYGGSDWDFLYSVACLPDQSILVAGESYSFSDGGSDAWVLHLNSVGDTIWTNHFGTTGNDAFKNINISPTAIYLSGSIDSVNTDGRDGYVVKLDYSGTEIWQVRYNNLGRDLLNGSVFTNDGNILIYGTTAEFDSVQNDIWLQKIDTNSTTLWMNNSGVPENDYVNKVIPIQNNELVIVGEKDPSGNGRKSMFLARYDANGNYIDSHSLGGGNDEEGFSGVRTMEGGLAFVGYTTSYGVANKDALLAYIRIDTTITPPMTYSNTIFIETLPVNTIDINEITNTSPISIFPNPATDYLTINYEPNYKIISVKLFDLPGRELFTSTNKNKIDLTSFSQGIYLITVKLSDGNSYTGKIIKE